MTRSFPYAEIIWVVGIALISLAAGQFFFIPIINDYKTLTPLYDLWFWYTELFLALVLIVYGLKEALKKFQDILGNIILCLALIGNCMMITFAMQYVLFIESSILYPPLNFMASEDDSTGTSRMVSDILIPVQLILLFALMLLAMRIGYISKKRPSNAPGWRG